MYTDMKVMAAKAHGHIQNKMYPEALAIAREIAQRWPQQPCGWSYLAELYGRYYGLGCLAAENATRGLGCRGVAETIYHQALLENSTLFANDCDMLAASIDGLLGHFPNHSMAGWFRKLRSDSGGTFSKKGLVKLHRSAAAGGVGGVAIGGAASHLDIAVKLLGEIGDTAEQEHVLCLLVDSLRAADQAMSSQRNHYGMLFAPADRLSLHYRAELFEEYADELFPNDAKILNRWASNYHDLDDLENTKRITERVLALTRYDKPLINLGQLYKLQGIKALYARDFASAKASYEEALAVLTQACNLGGENSSQTVAKQHAEESRMGVKYADANQIVPYPPELFTGTAQGLRALFEDEARGAGWIGAWDRFFSPFSDSIFGLLRFRVEDPAQAGQFIQELLNDYHPAIVASVLRAMRFRRKKMACCVYALLRIAGNPEQFGAMHRNALDAFAIFLFSGHSIDAVADDLDRYCRAFPEAEPTMLRSIRLCFGSVCEAVVKGLSPRLQADTGTAL